MNALGRYRGSMRLIKKTPVIIGGAMVVAGVAVGLGVANSSAGVVAAITGAATLVLVVVTAVYVWFTWCLVSAQRQVLQQAQDIERARAKADAHRLQRQGTVEVWKACHPDPMNWASLRNDVSKLLEGNAWDVVEKSAVSLDQHSGTLIKLASDIAGATTDVPDALNGQCWKTATLLMRLSNQLSLIRLGIYKVRQAAYDKGDAPNVDELPTVWTLEIRPQAEGVEWVEWEDIADASFIRETQMALDGLEATSYRMARSNAVA